MLTHTQPPKCIRRYSPVDDYDSPMYDSPENNNPAYDSPSPVDSIPHLHPLSAPHDQHHFPVHSYSTYRYLRNNPSLDHRRMSEPSLFANNYATPTTEPSTGRYQQFHFAYNNPSRPPHLHRGLSTGSLRDLHSAHHFDYPPSSHWKSQDHISFHSDDSALNHSFSSASPSLAMPAIQYPPIQEDPYGPSPPGTATSTSSNGPLTVSLPRGAPATTDYFHSPPPSDSRNSASFRTPDHQHLPRSDRGPNPGPNSKTYSFVSLPGNAVKKRPRRRYDEIERLYHCAWPDCTKAYGTLNHLNAHVTMQKHGQKRSPNEFKELRKQWRKAKKESDEQARSNRRIPSHDHRPNSHHSLEYPHPHQYPHHHQHTPLQHLHHQHHHAIGLPTSVTVPSLTPDGRYAGIDVPIDDIRFPIDDHRDYDRDLDHHDRDRDYEYVRDRERERERERDRERDRDPTVRSSQRYPTSSWHPTRSLSHGAYIQQQQQQQQPHPSLAHPHSHTLPPTHHSQHNQHQHHSQHQQHQQHQHQQHQQQHPAQADVMLNRLPADSTLLTPLPGYEPPQLPPPSLQQPSPSLLPPLSEAQGCTHGHHLDHGGRGSVGGSGGSGRSHSHGLGQGDGNGNGNSTGSNGNGSGHGGVVSNQGHGNGHGHGHGHGNGHGNGHGHNMHAHAHVHAHGHSGHGGLMYSADGFDGVYEEEAKPEPSGSGEEYDL